jgi:hypothetical protein
VKVAYGDLEEMLSELKEKEIRDVRLEALYDERHSKQSIPFLKVYVTAQALLSATLYASYERVTFRGIKPLVKVELLEKVPSKFAQAFSKLDELQAVFDRNLKAMQELKEYLKKERFWIRGGHFEE